MLEEELNQIMDPTFFKFAQNHLEHVSTEWILFFALVVYIILFDFLARLYDNLRLLLIVTYRLFKPLFDVIF